MLYRTMPQNGDELSILGFGCMRLALKDGNIDEARAISQIRHAIDQGVNYVDTAWPYHSGHSEPLLGKALEDGYREKVKVATKLPSFLLKNSEDMDYYLNAQLKKLGTDHIDYYLVHALNGPLWENVESLGVLDFLERAKADGRIVNVGFSFHGLLPDFKRIIDAYPWVFCQIQYNYLDQQNQAGTEGLKYAAAKNMGVIIMEPLRGGSLGLATPPPAIGEIWNEAETSRTPAEWSLRWVWNQPEVTVVLSGMNEETHVQENIAIANTARANSLTDRELALVERVSKKYQELMMVGCTGCGYCMPCPSNVSIPECFEAYNKMHLFNLGEAAKATYALRMSGLMSNNEPGYASQCVECGTCLDKCPQSIPIPDFLAKVAEELEDDQMEQRLAMTQQRLRGEG